MPPDTARKQRMKSDHDCYDRYGSRGDNIRRPAELQLSGGAPQDGDERDGRVKRSKSQTRFDKTQLKDHSGRTGVAKTKIRRPASPYHVTSMTVYQKDGDTGFAHRKDGGQQTLEGSADNNESDFLSSDVRAKWFLSTSQWQGFIPLQIPGVDSLCSEETSDIETQPACPDDVTESNEMSSAVSESLEKMKENHSLFYKIACDISISDTDITKNDGNSNAQTSSRPEQEGDELMITESSPDEETHNVQRSSSKEERKDSNQHFPSDVYTNSLSTDDKPQDSTQETQDNTASNTSACPAKEACDKEEIAQKECEDTSRQEGQSEKVKETLHGAAVQESNPDQALDENEKTREEHIGESENRKVNKERRKEMKKCRSLSAETKETAQERGNNHSMTPSSSVFEGGRVIRSASFGKGRVTVLRTSL